MALSLTETQGTNKLLVAEATRGLQKAARNIVAAVRILRGDTGLAELARRIETRDAKEQRPALYIIRGGKDQPYYPSPPDSLQKLY